MKALGQHGFTLVETLVSFAILAVMMVAGFQLAGAGLRAINIAATTEGAVLVAQSRMEHLVALGGIPQERSGTIDGTPYAWAVQVLPPDPQWKREPQARNMVHVRLQVSWRDRRGVSRIHLDRIIFVAEPVRP
jgi:prepilin-type N-terminal cleavage/methylation domain-containing protein